MLKLSAKWATDLAKKPETGMGYQIVSVILKDGTTFEQVVIVEGQITKVRGRPDIPFKEDQIGDIKLTHDKWDFASE